MDTQRIKSGKPLTNNTKWLYLNILIQFFQRAVRDGIIKKNPAENILRYKREESKREYLTIEEIKILANTPCKYKDIKRAFLFSCLTGLRYSDISALRYGDVFTEGSRHRLIFRQKKTHGQEYLDISKEAFKLIDTEKKQNNNDLIFRFRISRRNVNINITKWVKQAKINKHITFHCARHTFATMMLTLGTDLYTTSKLLGHRDITTTQIYAKIIDEKKRQAVDNIPSIF